jgi:4-alpha-glucanotransferase
MALKTAFGGKIWMDWGEGLFHRDPQALADWRSRLSEEVLFRKYLQYVFSKQWQSLKRYAHEKGIRIIGDIPIYVAHDSAEVWGNRELFYLDERGTPQVVAGVPPDYFSASGQRWGNPLYRWDLMARSGFHWWIERFRAAYALVGILRIDHFRGFEAYWEIPAAEATAVNGAWVKGPGASFFEKIIAALGDLPVIAEDLGVITPEVDELRQQFGFPGMRILQMAFGKDPKAPEYRPHHHVEDCVVYTGTHDHNTTVGWFTSPPGSQKTTQTPEEVAEERKFALQYLGTAGNEIHWDLIRLALGSVARMSLFPLQDVLGLGSEARMNLPGTASGNWEWRFTADRLTHPVRKKLRELTKIYERNP